MRGVGEWGYMVCIFDRGEEGEGGGGVTVMPPYRYREGSSRRWDSRSGDRAATCPPYTKPDAAYITGV
jgi:hypothetical protein